MDKKNQYFVCVGASAGGLEALEIFFKSMPNDTDLIFIVIQHLSPDYKSLMDELLARHTKMKIQVIQDGIETYPNNIYLIPLRKNLTIFHGKLYLNDQDNKGHINLPIDIFLKSLAKDQGKKAIGIILSGTGSDGTIGVRAIKESGGMVMVQTESSAKFDGMPKSSISTGLVDYILAPEEMPEELVNFVQHPVTKSLVNRALDDSEDFDDLTKISLIMRDFGGIDFSYYKENTILRRLDRRVKINRLDSLKSYIPFLKDSDDEKNILQREFLIGVTTFFRDTEAFQSLNQKVIPYLDYSKGVIRIWSAACSTGEEVYSLAILLNEYISNRKINCEIKLFATDIDTRALDFAGQGFYSESVIAEVDIALVEKYFIKHDDGYQICDSIRKMVVFAKHNILKDPPFSKLDLLVCRNMFIYIKSEHQRKILSSFYFSLNSKGYMFIGSSETIGDLNNAFTTVDSKWKIYKCRDGYRREIANEFSFGLSNKVPLSTNRIEPQLVNTNRSTEQLLTAIMSKIASPSIIIDSNDNIIQIINDVSDIISMQPGKVSNNFNSNMNKETGLFVNNIIRRLKQESIPVIYNNISIKGKTEKLYTITGNIVESNKSIYYMISFVVSEVTTTKNNLIEIDMSEEVKLRVKELETELQFAREGLQATIEELETSNEELQSSNEELIASNEELQSTNEELQSVNEELYTVNNEYQSKIGELTNLNNDLNNLIKNTDVGALYLDDRLNIRRVTPLISSLTNILKSDIGRSIKHISVMSSYKDLIRDIEKVSETLESIDREIIDEKNNYYLVRIRPYRTEYNAVSGIMVTFIDINKLKLIQKEYNQLSEHFNKSLNNGQLAYWTYDTELDHIEFSDSKAKMLGYESDEFPNSMEGRNKLIHVKDRDKLQLVIDECLAKKRDDWDLVYRIKRKDGEYAVHHDHGVISQYNDNGDVKIILGIITDITLYADILKFKE